MAVLWALLLVGCQAAYMLELEVVNESDEEAVIEVLGPGGEASGFRELVDPRSGTDLRLERPGPGGWSVVVNGEVVTTAREWPDDNPTIDLTILIEPDGSVAVEDT